MNLWDCDTLEGYFCADAEKYTAEQTEALFAAQYRAEMDDLEINGGSAEEYRLQARALPGFARWGVGSDTDGDSNGGYEFVKAERRRGGRGEFAVWAIKDGTEWDG
jgi:hypothetical protein